MAGHSKWKQIKHKKAITDAKKGQLFSKLVREIIVSAKTGGANPDINTRLRTAIERAKAQGLPKDNIERAVEKASGEGEEGRLQEYVYEATAPGGISIIIEGITDNKNRTLAEIKHLLSESGGKLAESGSLMWNFEKIGTIGIQQEENTGKTRDEIEEAIVESGAKDFVALEDSWLVETEFSGGEKVRKNLEKKGILIKESDHDYKPKNPVFAENHEALDNLLDLLLGHDDVQEVYTNLAEK